MTHISEILAEQGLLRELAPLPAMGIDYRARREHRGKNGFNEQLLTDVGEPMGFPVVFRGEHMAGVPVLEQDDSLLLLERAVVVDGRGKVESIVLYDRPCDFWPYGDPQVV